MSHLGMHIGGEANTPEAKRPFLDAIGDREDELLRCYRFVDEPMGGGSFGVDLYVKTSGGSPEIQAVRQKLGGDEFVSCMKTAFLHVDFSPTSRPTVLSYSLLFKLGDGGT